jgi:hypothetical protein
MDRDTAVLLLFLALQTIKFCAPCAKSFSRKPEACVISAPDAVVPRTPPACG